MDNNEAFTLFYKIIRDRAEYCDNILAQCAYKSVLSMFEYARENNIECLRQFDYYGEEEK